MARLAIYLLGAPRVECDGVEVHVPRHKALALLAYLALTGRTHERDALATFFWPEYDQSGARADLRRTLSLLNRTLGKEWIAVDRETVRLNPDAQVWMDVAAFQEHLARCAEHDHAPDKACPDCLPLLEEAVCLYGDDLLAGFTLRDSAPFDEWQFFETQSLRDQLAGALAQLASAYGERNENEQSIAHARRWLALDPLHEPAHRLLMHLYAASGQRAAALRQYNECVRLLQEELGVPPQEATLRAYEAIKCEPEPGTRGALRATRGYELQEPIGQGGFGVVYRGYQPAVDRAVAIKVISPEHANRPDFVQRFEREARLVARLEHPHIVPLYDYWREPDGAYLVMRWLRGGNLRESLQQGPWHPDAAARLLDQVAGALGAAHRQGIVHRDVKPENILLDEEGNAYLSDFGIAKDLFDSATVTATGTLVGSPAYTSPEQARGEPLTPQSDIYSLGVVMYEILTAEHPFSGTTPIEQIVSHLNEPLPALCERRPDLPPALEGAIQRATAKSPSRRYPEAMAFARDFREMLSDTPVMAAAPADWSMAETEEPRHNLPAQSFPFIGRRRELAELERLLGDPETRLVTIVGPGGMGKTRLALEAAGRLVEAYADGVYLISLAPLSSIEAIIPAIAQAIGFTFGTEGGIGQRSAGGSGAPRRQLLDYLRNKAMVLLSDNWEHLLDGVDLVTEILRAAPGIKILATSRARLNVQGEQLFYVEGMDLPVLEDRNLQTVAEADAVRLFLESARRVRAGFELAAEDVEHVVRICHLVGGMPLGVLLAAAWIDMLTPAEIVAEIQRGIDFLESDQRDLPERQHSIRALFDHSWSLLTEREREILAAMAVFVGGFTREAAREVADASLRDLRSLTDKSLLHATAEGRYGMHELLRQYAAERLAHTADGGAAARDRHCDYYAAALERWTIDLKSARQRNALAEMDVEIGNTRAAWDWAVAQGYVGQLDRTMESLYLFYGYRRRREEGRVAFEQAAHKLSAIVDAAGAGSANARRVLARALSMEGEFSERERNQQLQEQSLALLQHPELDESSTRRERADALALLSDILVFTERDRAMQLLERRLALAQAAGDRWRTANALLSLAFMAAQTGDPESARPLLEEAMAILRSLGDPQGLSAALAYRGVLEMAQGNIENAVCIYEEVIATQREAGHQQDVSTGCLYIGMALMYLGRYDEARQRLLQARETLQRFGIPRTLGMIGVAELYMGCYERAREEGEVATAGGRQEGNLWVAGNGLFATGGTLLAQGALVQARERLHESASYFRQLGQLRELVRVAAALGQIECQLDDTQQARAYLCEAIRAAQKINVAPILASTLPRIAVFLLDQGQDERAIDLYALALCDPHVANARWYEDTAGQFIAAAAECLPPERAAAARERGRARDLRTTVQELLEELEVNE